MGRVGESGGGKMETTIFEHQKRSKRKAIVIITIYVSFCLFFNYFFIC